MSAIRRAAGAFSEISYRRWTKLGTVGALALGYSLASNYLHTIGAIGSTIHVIANAIGLVVGVILLVKWGRLVAEGYEKIEVQD